MAAVKGYTGQVDLGLVVDSDVAYATHSWSLNLSAETNDITDFTTTGWRKFLAGLKGWDGSVELYVDSTNMIQPSDVGSEVTGRFYFNATNGLSGLCLITGWNPSVGVEGVETQTLNIQGSSDLTYF